ncbi:MAG: DNA cytosine methyltransferase [Actinomycetota bacterium]|nr:DNA cytosine methyltransferase [Actinomycetota bacterium]
MTLTAEHRPASRPRRFRHDTLVAVDLFSGFGGLSRGIEQAGFDVIMAANHNRYKVEVHEANHPTTEHWIADLVDRDAADYHSARDLPAGDLLAAGVSCVNHSQANTKKAYAQGMSLFDLEDPEFDENVTRSERDRATANCVLHYAAQHHPRLILIECTTELSSWGPAVPGKRKVGDGTTYRWWLRQFEQLGYRYRVLYLNSMFFGVPQSRDRLYIAFWDRQLPTPDLDHRPLSWCSFCAQMVEAVWTWRTGVPPTGSVRYGKQYEYRCPSCRAVVVPPMTPSLAALDLTDLGTRIGDRKKPLAPATMARAERCRQRFAELPAVLMPAKAARGSERHPWQPLATQTSQQETAILSTGSVIAAHRHNGDGKHITQPMDTVTSTHQKAVLLAVDNFQGTARGADEPLPTQGGSETLGMLSAGVIPYRQNTIPAVHAEAMPTVTAEQIPGVLTAAGTVQFNQGVDRRVSGVDRPLKTVVADNHMGLLFSGWFKQNGSVPEQFPAPHPLTDALGTVTAHDTTALLAAEWRSVLDELALEDCYFRMMGAHEIGRGCGFDVDFADQEGTFIVWGSARNQVDGFGNAVSPPVGEWIGGRLRAILHDEAVA